MNQRSLRKVTIQPKRVNQQVVASRRESQYGWLTRFGWIVKSHNER